MTVKSKIFMEYNKQIKEIEDRALPSRYQIVYSKYVRIYVKPKPKKQIVEQENIRDLFDQIR